MAAAMTDQGMILFDCLLHLCGAFTLVRKRGAPPFLTMTYASKICILQTECIYQFDSDLNQTIFYHGLCLKGKPWSCGHPVGRSWTI